MSIKMVREPSETPNINNIDDIIPMRYAYGGQNGFVIGKGTEISNTVSGLNFTVNSGRLVLQGVECDIDATGVTITIDNIATTRYYVVYLQVNLGLNTAQILDTYDTATYPNIDTGDDLTENTTGIARLPLYKFVATSGVISEVNKVVESVKYINESFIKNVKVDNAAQADNATTSSNTIKVNNVEITQPLRQYQLILDTTTISLNGTANFENNLARGDTIEVIIDGDQVFRETIRLSSTTAWLGTINGSYCRPVLQQNVVLFKTCLFYIYNNYIQCYYSHEKGYNTSSGFSPDFDRDTSTSIKIYKIIQ